MLHANEFWRSLKRRFAVSAWVRGGAFLFASVVLPIFENIITGVATAATTNAWVVWLALGVVGAVHLFLAITLLVLEWATPELKLAQAAEIQEDALATERELNRRNEAYGMVRECLTMLTRKTCDLPDAHGGAGPGMPTTQDAHWCQSGFESGLGPIVDVIAKSVTTILGVTTSRYTIEMYAYPGYVSNEGAPKEHNGLHLWFFTSPTEQRSVTLLPPNESPAVLAATWGVPNQQHISESKALFFANDRPKPEIYFRRFATCPINEACSDNSMGVLVLTSMQDEEFAGDVLDTLQFLGSIMSNYVSAYCACRVEADQTKAVAAILGDVPFEKRFDVAHHFGLTHLACCSGPFPPTATLPKPPVA